MNVTILVLVVAAAVAFALFTKPRGRATGRRLPRPGEGLRRRDVPGATVGTPRGVVALRRGLPASEAHVVAGLLRSAGIDASLNPAHGMFVTKGLPTSFDLYVAAEQADEANELLARAS